MAREDTDLPFGDAFSPAQLEVDDDEEELRIILELIDEHEGDVDSFDEEIQERFFPSFDRAKNVHLGVGPAGYKLVDDDFNFTEIGEELYELRDDSEELYDRFAQHILKNLHGLKGIEIIEDLRAQGRSTTNDDLKREFKDQYDFHIDETSNHWSQMRAWLSKAGVVNTGTQHYDIDRARIEELVGLGEEDILELDRLTEHQQAFLRALAQIDPSGQVKNKYVKQFAEKAYGVEISQSNISRRTLDPLEEAGFIEWEHVSGKANWVEPTAKFESEVLKPILEDIAQRTGVPREVIRKSYSELLDDLDADSTFEKGIALETLAVKIGRLLGLNFVGWRVRGRQTGGSEVDVVFDDVSELFNRVQIQCKNIKGQLETKHIAREVGISRMLQTTTILMIARNGLSGEAQQFANRVMRDENLAIMFLTGEDIEKMDDQTTHLLNALQGEARRISNIKDIGESEYVEDEDDQEIEDREQEVIDKYDDEIVAAGSEEDLSLGEFTEEDS